MAAAAAAGCSGRCARRRPCASSQSGPGAARRHADIIRYSHTHSHSEGQRAQIAMTSTNGQSSADVGSASISIQDRSQIQLYLIKIAPTSGAHHRASIGPLRTPGKRQEPGDVRGVHLDAEGVVFEVAVPGRDLQLGALGNHLLHALSKLLRILLRQLCLRLQEVHVAHYRPASHQLPLNAHSHIWLLCKKAGFFAKPSRHTGCQCGCATPAAVRLREVKIIGLP